MKMSDIQRALLEPPEVEYVCSEKHENVPETLEERVARCGVDRCKGIALFRSTFILTSLHLLSVSLAGGFSLERATLGLEVALFAAQVECEKAGHCLTFRKYAPVVLVFGCQFCEREEKVQLNEQLECTEE